MSDNHSWLVPDAQQQVIYMGKSAVSFVTSSRHINKKGTFFVKAKYDPSIVICKIEV